MTKRQQLDACRALAPDFSMRFERPNGLDTIVASATTADGPVAIAMPVAGLGRAATETRVLEAALRRLQQKES